MHRVRVEHNKDTLLIHISGEDGHGWTTLAIDRTTREWSIAQRHRQLDAATPWRQDHRVARHGEQPNPGVPAAS